MHEISYINAIMYSRAVPMPGDDAESDNAPIFDATKDACQDIDLESTDEEIIVKK